MPQTVTKEQVQSRITDALVEFGEERDAITPDARFEDLDIDSLDLVELAQIIEEEYGVELADSDMDKLETVSDVIELIAERA